MTRKIVAIVILALATGSIGYGFGLQTSAPAASASALVSDALLSSSSTPSSANDVRLIYSLDAKQNDKEIISLINNAQKYIYFAMYEFTLKDIADALVAAKNRGVDVKGIVDSVESAKSYDAPVIAELRMAGIPVGTEHHASGNGIMHIKAIVTERAYASGSYNWTASATNVNDEVLEIGTNPTLRSAYENILKRLIDEYGAGAAAAPVSGGVYDYADASTHVGEYASVHGTVLNAHISSSGTVFFDYCKDYKSCPFSAVIFADDAKKFGDISIYSGKTITVIGKISSYQNHAEIILNDPSQIAN